MTEVIVLYSDPDLRSGEARIQGVRTRKTHRIASLVGIHAIAFAVFGEDMQGGFLL